MIKGIRMIRFMQIVCISAIFTTLSAQSLINDPFFTARTSSTGGAGSALSAGSEALIVNPSRLGFSFWPDIHFFHTQLYQMPELPLSRIQAAFPLRNGWAGISWASLSNTLYQENLYTIGYAKNIFSNLYLGVSIVYNNVNIYKHACHESLFMTIGTSLQMDTNTAFAIVIRDIFISGSSHNLRTNRPSITAGLKQSLSDYWLITLEAEHNQYFPIEIKAGTSLTILDRLEFRTGFRQQPSGFTWGFTALFGLFNVDYSAVLHPFLGATHFFGLTLYPCKM